MPSPRREGSSVSDPLALPQLLLGPGTFHELKQGHFSEHHEKLSPVRVLKPREAVVSLSLKVCWER